MAKLWRFITTTGSNSLKFLTHNDTIVEHLGGGKLSKVYFISDLHLGHKNILKFSPERGGTDMQSHSEWLVSQWNSVVTKQDLVWVLGDVCFDSKHMFYLKQMHGSKHLILGNHDKFTLKEYFQYFNKVHGFMGYKKAWLSHAPVHPNSLRNKINIHGHLHQGYVRHEDGTLDRDYFNVSVEALGGVPINYNQINILLNTGGLVE